MANSRKKWLCLDCKIDTGKIGEHYMLVNSTWDQIHNSNIGMFCVNCAEKRLGRRLKPSDFHNCYINHKNYGTRSVKLTQRMGLK